MTLSLAVSSAIMLGVIMLSAAFFIVMLSVIMLSVVYAERRGAMPFVFL
jgi:hypothetical protein